jgi:cellulose synthase operon protein C
MRVQRKHTGLAAGRIVALLAVLLLVGCKTERERASELLQAGLAQEQRGDDSAARRFYLDAMAADASGTEALRSLARLEMRRDRYDAALSAFTALQERSPDDAEANLALADLALRSYDTEAASRFIAVAEKQTADDPKARGARAAVSFYVADYTGDATASDQAIADLQTALAADPAVFAARAALVLAGSKGLVPGGALPLIEAGLALGNRRLDLQMMKLSVLETEGTEAESLAHLKEMYAEFPDNPDLQTWLSEHYSEGGDPEEGIAFFLDLAARRPDRAADDSALRRFVTERLPTDKAASRLDEIAATLGEAEAAALYRVHAATLRFAAGDRDAALEVALGLTAEDAPLARSAEALLAVANMLTAMNRTADSEAMLDRVLAVDPTNRAATDGKARALLARKDFDGVIALLRPAVAAAAPEVGALTLLADAYEGKDLPDLAQDLLGRAYELSGKALPESLRFVRFLIKNDHAEIARRTAADALSLYPGDPELTRLAASLGVKVTP